jgi:hypothetical protein
VLWLPLRRHVIKPRFREYRSKIPYVLRADALKVVLFDIVQASCVRGRKAGRLHVDMEVGNIDVARAQSLGRQLTRIGRAARVRDLVAAVVRRGKRRIPTPFSGRSSNRVFFKGC